MITHWKVIPNPPNLKTSNLPIVEISRAMKSVPPCWLNLHVICQKPLVTGRSPQTSGQPKALLQQKSKQIRRVIKYELGDLCIDVSPLEAEVYQVLLSDILSGLGCFPCPQSARADTPFHSEIHQGEKATVPPSLGAWRVGRLDLPEYSHQAW